MFSGLIGIFIGFTVNVDLLNYHYYAPFAVLHNRIGFDFFPCTIQSYFNPYLDFPFYFLVKYLNSHPNLILFLNNIYYGVYAFLIYKLTDLIFKPKGIEKLFYITFALVMSMSAPLLLAQVNANSNDMHISMFALLGLYIICRYIFNEDSKKRNLFLISAGLIFGLISGLKYSGAVFFLGLLLSLLFLTKRIAKPLKSYSLILTAFFIGFLISDASWLYSIYVHFKNPFYPYFNNIFKSPYADLTPVLDKDYMHLRPKNLYQFIFYPFLWLNRNFMNGTERFYYDLRYPLAYISIPIILILYKRAKELIDTNYAVFLSLFYLFTYFISLLIFAQYRYVLLLNSLSGILFIIAIYAIFPKMKNIRYISLLLLSIVIFSTTKYIYKWDVVHPKGHLMEIGKANIKDNATVLMASKGMSIFIPFQNHTARFVFFAFPTSVDHYNNYQYHNTNYSSKYLEKELYKIINKNPDNLYIIFKYSFMAKNYDSYVKSMDIYTDGRFEYFYDCEEIPTNLKRIVQHSYTICKVKIKKSN